MYSGPDSTPIKARVNQVLKFEGLERKQATEAGPGDIVLINGIEGIGIGVTLTDLDDPVPLPMLNVDEPTLTMNFCVNNSPLAGREGKFVTSRQIRDRLDRELQCNVALRVSRHRRGRHLRGDGPRRAAPDDPAREHAPRRLRAGGLQAARRLPRVDGDERHEPIELVTADVEDQHQGARHAGARRAPGRAGRTWSPTAWAACASTTGSRRAA